MTVFVTEATFVGPKITASAIPGVAGADWPLVRSDGTLLLDVRLDLRTDDGADIYVSYAGVGPPSEMGCSRSGPPHCSRRATRETRT